VHSNRRMLGRGVNTNNKNFRVSFTQSFVAIRESWILVAADGRSSSRTSVDANSTDMYTTLSKIFENAAGVDRRSDSRQRAGEVSGERWVRTGVGINH